MIISILGCGWLGLPLARKLAAGFTVKGSTTTPSKLELLENAGLQPFLLDLDTHRPADFFDCEVLVITMPASVIGYEDKIKRAIDLINQHNVKKVVFISTSSVYPNLNREVIEADAAYIRSPHSGVTMLAIEDLFRDQTFFESTIIRFAGLYGPERPPGRFLAGKVGLKGATSPVNLIHLDDCIEIIYRIIMDSVWGETFNACSDEHPNRSAFYERAATALGLEPPTFSGETAPHKIVISERLKSQLGYTFLHSDPMLDVAG